MVSIHDTRLHFVKKSKIEGTAPCIARTPTSERSQKKTDKNDDNRGAVKSMELAII